MSYKTNCDWTMTMEPKRKKSDGEKVFTLYAQKKNSMNPHLETKWTIESIIKLQNDQKFFCKTVDDDEKIQSSDYELINF